MLKLNFDKYKIELSDETNYSPNSTDNSFLFQKTFVDEESDIYYSTKYGVKVYEGENF